MFDGRWVDVEFAAGTSECLMAGGWMLSFLQVLVSV